MEENRYIINESRLKTLLQEEYWLMALERGGVDNWSHYWSSISEYLKELAYFNDISVSAEKYEDDTMEEEEILKTLVEEDLKDYLIY